jgi:hypothetical protein
MILQEGSKYWLELLEKQAALLVDSMQWDPSERTNTIWTFISRHAVNSLIDTCSDMPWKWSGVCKNKNINNKQLKAAFNKYWCWQGIQQYLTTDQRLWRLWYDLHMRARKWSDETRFNIFMKSIALWLYHKSDSKPLLKEKCKNILETKWFTFTDDYDIVAAYSDFKNMIGENDFDHFCKYLHCRLESNMVLNLETIKKYNHWNWRELSMNPNITPQFIAENMDKPWNCGIISSVITWDIYTRFPDNDWFWMELSRNPNITMAIIEENPDKPWNLLCVCENPNVTWEFIESHLDKPISPYFNKILRDHPPFWNSVMSSHTLATLDIIVRYIDKPWCWGSISAYNPNITWEIVRNNMDKPWRWDMLILNPNITLEDIEANKHLLSISEIYKRQDLNIDFVIRNNIKIPENKKDELYMINVSVDEEVAQHILRFRSARKIQRAWLQAYYNPDYMVCQKRIAREFCDLAKSTSL